MSLAGHDLGRSSRRRTSRARASLAIEAQRAQVAAYRRMQPEQRVALAVKMSEEAREITESGIRARCPQFASEDVRRRLLRMLLGETLYLESGIDERG